MFARPDTKVNRRVGEFEFFKEDVGHGCVVMLPSMDNDVLNGSTAFVVVALERAQQRSNFYKLWPRSHNTYELDIRSRMPQWYSPRVASVWRTTRDRLEWRQLQ